MAAIDVLTRSIGRVGKLNKRGQADDADNGDAVCDKSAKSPEEDIDMAQKAQNMVERLTINPH